ncbi:MAG: hypothetical protein HY898_35080 [Deltaproteobacteria bacterium]|nr:hypothetical protein [Deltaproteobacteria bacterium]
MGLGDWIEAGANAFTGGGYGLAKDVFGGAPTAATPSQYQFDWTAQQEAAKQQAEWRAKQFELAQALERRMNGTAGPTPEELQMQQGLSSNVASSNAMAASAQGGGLAHILAQRNAQQQQAQMGQQTAMAGMIARAQAQREAERQLQALYGAGREGDRGMGQQAINQQQVASGSYNTLEGTKAGVASGNADRQTDEKVARMNAAASVAGAWGAGGKK